MTTTDTAFSEQSSATPNDLDGGSRPLFSVVSAVYNVARYLPDYIDALDAQTYDDTPIQIIVVDDGSTDESLSVLHQWAQRNPHVTILTQENAGQGAARNYGLTVAEGRWVTFIDPDDSVPSNYFAAVADFLQAHPEVISAMANRIFYQEKLGRLQDGHPLKWMFADGDIVVNLNDNSRYMQNGGNVVFFQLDRIREHNLKFDPRVKPHFEDVYFSIQYIMTFEEPIIGFIKSARYLYRKRADGSAALQNTVSDPRRYIDVVRYAYIPMLEQGKQRYGFVPEWLQNIMLYELRWYFGSEDSLSGAETAAIGEVAESFLDGLKVIRSYIDDEVIESFRVIKLNSLWRDMLLHSFNKDEWVSERVVIKAWDQAKDEVKVISRFIGPKPEITYFSGGHQVEPVARKTCGHTYFEKVLLREEIAWIPARGTLRVEVNGQRAEIARYWFGAKRLEVAPKDLQWMFRRKKRGLRHKAEVQYKRVKNRVENRPKEKVLSHGWTFLRKTLERKRRYRLSRNFVHSLAATPTAQKKYAEAWVFMDRIHNSNDNAEDLFHYVRKNRPDINAWFVLQEGTEDWKRLKRSGEKRLIAYGSLNWRVLMMHCDNLISSHIDQVIYRPKQITRLRKPTWNFTFLEHGVFRCDLSGWLNSKQIDLMVTSTPAEYQSVVADDSSYVFTEKEVKLTGMPRFDRLKRTADALPASERNLLLVAPTWRVWLNTEAQAGLTLRTVNDDFLDSEFVTQWMAFLTSDRLKKLADDHGLTIGFLPHPNLQTGLRLLQLPDYVTPLTYATDIKETLAKATLFVTDYTSIFFDAAYINCPTTYFQFDFETTHSGGHIGRLGYFDYERDGFGPVATTVEQALEGVEMLLGSQEQGVRVPPPYAQRIEETFPQRDGQCCQRVTAAIEALGQPVPADNPYLAVQQLAGQRLTHTPLATKLREKNQPSASTD